MELELTTEIGVTISVDVENVQSSTPEFSISSESATATKEIIPFGKETGFESAKECSLQFQTVNAFVAGISQGDSLLKRRRSAQFFIMIAITVDMETPTIKEISDRKVQSKEEMVSGSFHQSTT